MQIVPLAPNPNQTLQIVLAGQNCAIELSTLDGYAITDNVDLSNSQPFLAFTLSVSGTSITQNQNCLNLKRLLINRQYLGFLGDLMFVDTQPDPVTGPADPQYAGLGTRWQLVYITADELASLTELPSIAVSARPGPGPAIPSPTPAPPFGTTIILMAGKNGNPCCACDPNVTYGYAVAPLTPLGAAAPTSIFGAVIEALSWNSGGAALTLIIEDDTLPQNEFTTLTIIESSVALNSVDAMFATLPGPPSAASWTWSLGSSPFADGETYHCVFT